MASSKVTIRAVARALGEAAAETLWPTRCAVCDTPGEVLCGRCAAALPHLDWWRACKRCGAPFGAVQCTSCSSVALDALGREEYPFAGCASATVFNDMTGRIVRVFKDQGEQRLALAMAQAMERVIVPAWDFDAVTFVPATKAAFSRRGYDHARLIALELSRRLGMACLSTLERPRTRDQRALARNARLANLEGRFRASDKALPSRLLLVDDVYTTGATLCAAADALRAQGADTVFALTFARV